MTTRISTVGEADTTRTSRGPRLGLALFVIATAQLMIVLDSTVVNVALPHIQSALHFSGSGLEWVINAYALTLGGFMLLGGRAGDLFGRRRMFIAGLLLFAAASLAGGLATSSAWLLAARAVQGVGGAVAAPAALSLIATTFPEGPSRNRAMGVYAAMSGVGGAVGLIAGGLLVTYANWRWVLFVNVPIGLAVALAAPMVLPVPGRGDGGRQSGRLDLPGAVTGTGAVAALVYGLSNAATGSDGVSHWGDPKVVISLVAGALLLAAFVAIEARSQHPLLPLRLLRDRDRLGANLIMLGTGTAIFGIFFFVGLFAQDVLGYSPLRTGLSFLPLTIVLLLASITAGNLISRIGVRPLLLAGTAICVGGMYWLAQLSEHDSYPAGLLGPSVVIGLGLGLLFVPLPLVALTRVPAADSGAAASLLNVGRQVGGSIGLALLGTVAWTVVSNTAHPASTTAPTAAHPTTTATQTATAAAQAAYRHALAVGFDRAFLVAAAIAVLMLLTALTTIRVRHTDLPPHP